jgi:hypothetical protein
MKYLLNMVSELKIFFLIDVKIKIVSLLYTIVGHIRNTSQILGLKFLIARERAINMERRKVGVNAIKRHTMELSMWVLK